MDFCFAQQNESVASKWNIHNCVNKFDPESLSPTKVGSQYWFADANLTEGLTLKMSIVKPFQATHAPHTHAGEEFFVVLEGVAKFYLNGDSVVCGPLTSFYCPPMMKHGIRNAGDTELKYLVINVKK